MVSDGGKGSTLEAVYIEHSREMKRCLIYAGVQCTQVLPNTTAYPQFTGNFLTCEKFIEGKKDRYSI